MAYALVGSAGAVSQSATGASVTPAWGTSESRTANNLLICWIAVDGNSSAPATPSGWSLAVSTTGTSSAAAVFYKIAAGSDAAPTISAVTSGIISAQLAEFSGNASVSPLDKTGSNSGTTSSLTATTAGADAQSGELVIAANAAFYSASATKTFSLSMNNGATATAASNAATSTANHYDFGYGVTTGNSAADNQTFTFTTTKITGVAQVVASFKLKPAAFTQASFRVYADGTESGSTALEAQDTNYTDDISGGDKNLGLRLRLQETAGASGNSTDDYQLQYAYNGSGYYTNVGNGKLFSGLSEANSDLNASIGAGKTNKAVGQALNLPAASTITNARFYIDKVGSPTGNITANLYAVSGSVGSTGVPTGATLASSSTVDIATGVTTTQALVSFSFSSYAASAGNYFLSIEYDGGDASNYLNVGTNGFTPGDGSLHPGNIAYQNTGTSAWSAVSTGDLIFYLEGAVAVQGYSSANLTDGGSTTNRLGSGSGSFVAGLVSEGGNASNLQITASNYSELLYSLTVKSTAVSAADTLDFRVLRNGSALNSYTLTPRITIASAAPVLVQQTSGIDTAGSTGSISVAFPTNTAAGNMLFAVIGSANGSANTNLTSFADSNAGNTWTKIVDNNTNQGNGLQVWVCYNCAGGASTISVNDGSFATAMAIGEVYDIASSSAFDQQNITDVSGTNPSGGTTSTLSQASEFVLAIAVSGVHNGGAYTAGTGYSNFLAQPGQYVDFGIQSNVVSSTTGVTTNFGGGTSAVDNKIGILTFKAPSSGSTLTKTQSAVARIANNITKTQSAIARIQRILTKTQSAVSRVANTLTKTQSAVSRISNTSTKTQSAVARIATNLTKTQPATARIQMAVTKTQSAVSRISQTYTKTQSSIARVANTLTKTQSAKATIIGAVAKTQSAIARIANTETKTQSATARIARILTKTQSSVARIANIETKTQSAISRIAVIATKTQGAVSRVANTLTKTQSATAAITTASANSKTQSAVARIANTLTKNQGGVARIATVLTKTQSATARIQRILTKAQPAVARIANTLSRTQSAVARIANTSSKTQAALARIANTLSKTQSATARISQTFTKTQGAIARISNTPTKTQSAVARIQQRLFLTQPATASIIQSGVSQKTQSAVARIKMAVTKTQTAVARIATQLSKTQSATARLAQIYTKTQSAVSRIAQTYTKTQQAKARIASTLASTQPGVARIQVVTIRTQPAISRISQTYSTTQSAISRISHTFTKVQTAIARVVEQLTYSQPALARIELVMSATQSCTARIAIAAEYIPTPSLILSQSDTVATLRAIDNLTPTVSQSADTPTLGTHEDVSILSQSGTNGAVL